MPVASKNVPPILVTSLLERFSENIWKRMIITTQATALFRIYYEVTYYYKVVFNGFIGQEDYLVTEFPDIKGLIIILDFWLIMEKVQYSWDKGKQY